MFRSRVNSLEPGRAATGGPADGERVLFRSSSVTILDLDAVPHDGGLLACHRHWHRLVFGRAEASALRGRPDAAVALPGDPVQVRSLAPGQPWPGDLPAAYPVTVIAFEPTLLAPALDARGSARAEMLRFLGLDVHITASPAVLLRCRQLRQALRRPRSTREGARLAIEDDALVIFQELIALWRCEPARARPARPTRRRRELAESAKALLLAAPTAAHPLGKLAEELDVSPSHLAHVFRAEMGVPIHQYLLYVRLAVALDHLAAGEEQLSRLALDLGFASHSHFSAVFRKAFGMPPIAVRARPERGRARGLGDAPAVRRADAYLIS